MNRYPLHQEVLRFTMSFSKLGLNAPLVSALTEQGYTKPTPVQEATIEAAIAGQDVMASAQTGTGKTAAFTLPILQGLSAFNRKGRAPRALILTPTRELAAQVLSSVETYGRHLPHRALSVYGGVKIRPQIDQLKRGVDVVVATPGRLIDLCQQKAIDLRHIEVLVLDEADRMLDMGFIHAIRDIQSRLPSRRQSLMFSATFSREIRELAKSMLQSPIEVDVAPRRNTTAESVEQCVIPIDKKRKAEALIRLYDIHGGIQSLVFTRTKHGANKLVKVLKKSGIRAEAIHGNKSQSHRTRVLGDFKNDRLTVLVATDIASRGLDISELPLVINYELPQVPEDYVHRIGRTGRAGRDGFALSLVCADEASQLHGIEKLTGNAITRELLEDFEPEHQVPERPRRNGENSPRRNGENSPRRNGENSPRRNGGKNRQRDNEKARQQKRRPRRRNRQRKAA